MSVGPRGAYNFLVDVSGVSAAAFAECVLPAASIEAVESKERKSAPKHARKILGLAKQGNLVLTRGLVNSKALWDWYSSLGSGGETTATVTVTLLDDAKKPAIKWSFTNAWPVKYEGPVLDGKTNDLAIETLELAVDETIVISSAAQSSKPKGTSGRARPPRSTTKAKLSPST